MEYDMKWEGVWNTNIIYNNYIIFKYQVVFILSDM